MNHRRTDTDVCPRCKGKGHVPTEAGEEGDVKSCPDCDGTGEAEEPMDDATRYALLGAM
jgi:DnaJ-class molecular chaperone